MLGGNRPRQEAEVASPPQAEHCRTSPPEQPEGQRALLISVIVPVYNGSATLERALACIDHAIRRLHRSRKWIHVERIVVDDHSNDDSATIAEAERWKVVALPRNHGPGVARNYGVANSHGDLLVFVDADALIPEDALSRLVEDYEDPTVGAITSLLDRAHHNRDFFSQFKNLHMHYSFRDLPREVAFLYGTLHSIRREHFVPYDPQLLLTCDTRVGQVLARRGVSVILDHTLLIGHLKKHNLLSLLSNDFRVPIEWGARFFESTSLSGLLRSRRYAHAVVRQLLSLLSAGMALAAATFGHFAIGVGLLATFYLLNMRFICFLRSERGWWFAINSAGFLLLDSIVMAVGAALGMGSSFFR